MIRNFEVCDFILEARVRITEETELKFPVTETKRFEWGRVGISSFQGMLDCDDVTLWVEAKVPPTVFRPFPDGSMKKDFNIRTF